MFRLPENIRLLHIALGAMRERTMPRPRKKSKKAPLESFIINRDDLVKVIREQIRVKGKTPLDILVDLIGSDDPALSDAAASVYWESYMQPEMGGNAAACSRAVH